MPSMIPNTKPEPLIVATDVAPLVQVPVEVVSERSVIAPMQTFIDPVIRAGTGIALTAMT